MDKFSQIFFGDEIVSISSRTFHLFGAVALRCGSYFPADIFCLFRKKLSSFNWMGKGLKRQLPLQSQEKEKKSFIFRRREKDTTQTSSLSNQIALTG